MSAKEKLNASAWKSILGLGKEQAELVKAKARKPKKRKRSQQPAPTTFDDGDFESDALGERAQNVSGELATSTSAWSCSRPCTSRTSS